MGAAPATIVPTKNSTSMTPKTCPGERRSDSWPEKHGADDLRQQEGGENPAVEVAAADVVGHDRGDGRHRQPLDSKDGEGEDRAGRHGKMLAIPDRCRAAGWGRGRRHVRRFLAWGEKAKRPDVRTIAEHIK